MFASLMSILLLGATDPAASAPTAPPAASPPVRAAPAPAASARKPRAADTTCWVEQPTGSHIRTPVCATREELEKAQRDAHDAVTAELRTSAGGFHK